VSRLAEEVKKIVEMPDVVTQLRELGAEAHSETPAEFQRTVQADVVRWRKIVEERSLVLD
jgi:tripartite-type tricarboxylate transporter receptor subunit TctC